MKYNPRRRGFQTRQSKQSGQEQDHKTSRIFGAFIRTFLSALCSIRPCFTVSLLLYYVTTIILLFYTHNCPIGDYTWSHQHTCIASRETLKEGYNTTELDPFEILWVIRRSVGKAYMDCRYPLGSDYISFSLSDIMI